MKRGGCIVIAAVLVIGLIVLASQIVTFGDSDKLASSPKTQAGLVGPTIIVPVAGVSRAQLVDSWGDDRDQGARAHAALDIPAPAGTPVIAAMAGKVEKLYSSKAGGITAYVRSPHGRWLCYYAHLQRYAVGLAEGQSVRQGQSIGRVGDTGNAGAGNTHLHFAVHRMTAGERWYEGTPVNPYRLLAAKAPSR